MTHLPNVHNIYDIDLSRKVHSNHGVTAVFMEISNPHREGWQGGSGCMVGGWGLSRRLMWVRIPPAAETGDATLGREEYRADGTLQGGHGLYSNCRCYHHGTDVQESQSRIVMPHLPLSWSQCRHQTPSRCSPLR